MDENNGVAEFRYISQDTRKKMSKEDFAASGMRFPIQKREDVHAAVVRLNSIPESERASVRAGIIRIAKRKGWMDALPDSWGVGKNKKKATMSDPNSSELLESPSMEIDALFKEDEGDFFLYKNAKIFEAGEYPDKGLNVSPEDLLSMVYNFKPLQGDLEHIFARTEPDKLGNLAALKGELTELRSVYVDSEDPYVLRGDIAVRKWLDPKLEGKGISVEIPIENPVTLSGYTLTTKPRVRDAALMSELENHIAATRKEEPPKKESKMTDLGKAVANFLKKAEKEPALLAQFSESDDPDAGDINTPKPTPKPEKDPAIVQMMADYEIMKQQIAASARREREADAKVLYSEYVGKKLTPASQQAFLMFCIQASTDDAVPNNKPVVATFDDKGNPVPSTSRLSLLRALLDSLPNVSVPTGEQWAGGNYHVIGGSQPLANFSETDADLDKWEEDMRKDEYRLHGVAYPGSSQEK